MFRCFIALELSLFLLGATPDAGGAEDHVMPSASGGHALGHARQGPAEGGHRDGHIGDAPHHGGRPYRHSYGHHPHHVGPSYAYPYPSHWGYDYHYPPYYYPAYPPPLYIPAEELYGPQAVMRLMGIDHWFRPQPNVNILVVPNRKDPAAAAGAGGAAAPAPAAPAPVRAPQRATNAESLALAWKFIGYGDAHFATQKYLEANARYRKAVRAAPQLADGYFRQGYAYLAMGRHDLAADAIRRGLGLDPAWPKSAFNSEELYGDNDLAKNAHLDALAKASEEDPTSADLLFLLGVFLHFDDQPDRAKAFFQRAAQLAGGNDGHIRAFLQ